MRLKTCFQLASALAGVAAGLGGGLPASAQISSTPTLMTPPAVTPLPIPVPPGATVQVEMDVHDDDLLGVFKSFLRGIGQGANYVPPASPHPAMGGPVTARAQMVEVLNNADLSDIFKDTTHVHMEVFGAPGGMSAMMMTPPIKSVKGKTIVTSAPKPATLSDQTSFYETAFGAEGGHRIIYVNYEPVHVLMTSFGHGAGYALMMQGPGTLAVLRADGYPDLSKLSALASRFGAAAADAAIRAEAENKPDKKKPDAD